MWGRCSSLFTHVYVDYYFSSSMCDKLSSIETYFWVGGGSSLIQASYSYNLFYVLASLHIFVHLKVV